MRGGQMRVIITGAAGFIGTHLCFSLAGSGHSVLALDDLSHGADSFSAPEAKGIEFREADVSKPESDMASVMRDFQADAVCHLADASQASPSWDTHMYGRYADALVNTVEAAAEVGVGKFVYASSADYLFGRECDMPVRDTTRVRPANLFGVHKFNCERAITHVASKHKLRCATLRLPYVYGPSAPPPRKARKGRCFVADALRRRGRPLLRIEGDGNQTRDFLWVADAVSAFEIALRDRGLLGVVNVGTEIETPVRKVIEKIEEMAGRVVRVEYLYKKKDSVPRSQVNASAMREHRWLPKTSIVRGLENLLSNGIEADFTGEEG